MGWQALEKRTVDRVSGLGSPYGSDVSVRPTRKEKKAGRVVEGEHAPLAKGADWWRSLVESSLRPSALPGEALVREQGRWLR